jgi:hypothetical protein
MKVQVAKIVEYATSSGPWKTHRLDHPPFEDIESALRRLDGNLHPSLALFLGDSPPADGVPDFEVLGGHCGYYVQAPAGGTTCSYYDARATAALIPVWISDQGVRLPAQRVCPDLGLVISAARHFCETGELLPTFPWRSL